MISCSSSRSAFWQVSSTESSLIKEANLSLKKSVNAIREVLIIYESFACTTEFPFAAFSFDWLPEVKSMRLCVAEDGTIWSWASPSIGLSFSGKREIRFST